MSTTYQERLGASTSRVSGTWPQTITAASSYLGSAVANNTNLDPVADLEVVWSFSVAPVSGYLTLHWLWALDGTNFEEGASGTAPLPGCAIATLTPLADTATHRKSIRNLPLAPYPFKLLVVNSTGQSAVVTLNLSTRQDTVVG